MSINELSEKLKDLQDELMCLNAAEQRTRSEIEAVLLSICKALKEEKRAEQESEQKAQLQSFNKYLLKFEAEHPELTASINRVLVTLGNMGI